MNTTVQLNVRMERELRDAGNTVLESRAISPSLVVRSLWQIIAQRGQALEDVLALLFGEDEQCCPVENLSNPVDQGQALYCKLLADVGLEGANLSESLYTNTYEQMQEDALLERWREKGLDRE